MKFKELIAASTPGPLFIDKGALVGRDTVTLVAACSPARGKRTPDKAEEANALRLAHSYNVLPEVVTILEDALSEIPANARLPLVVLLRDKINSAIAKAKTITP